MRGHDRHEVTSFRGHHRVECYILKNRVVVARDGISVPISVD
ncbi:nucleotide-binding domain-containing protein [Arthrobacter sp. PGP41]